MELIIDRDQLVQALQFTNLAVSSKPTIEILSNLLLEINKGSLIITSTDLDIFIKHRIAIDSEIKARLTAPARKLRDIIASLPDAEITFKINPEKNKLYVIGKKTKFSINTVPADDFPKVEITDKQKSMTIPQPVLKEILSKTVFAVSKNESKHTLKGLCLEIKDKKITLIGTDGRRLAVVSHDIDLEIENSKYILPQKAIKQLLNILQTEGETNIYLSNNHACFKVNNTILGVRLIEGEYPEYRKIIPKESKIEFNLEVEKLIAATKRAALFTKEGSGVKYSFDKNRLTLSANIPEIGEAIEKMEIEGSEQINIVFNPLYVLDALQNVNTEKVVFSLNDGSSPALIEPVNNGGYLQLIMPMQT